MTEPLGLSIGMTNLVAARVGRPPVIRRAVLHLFGDRPAEVGVPADNPNVGQPGGLVLSGFVDRVGDPVPLVAADGSAHRGELVLAEALEAMARTVDGGAPVAIAVPAHWGPGTVGALRGALRGRAALAPGGLPAALIPDSTAALAALQAAPGLPDQGVIVLVDLGGSGTSISLADAGANLDALGQTVRYPDFSGDAVDQALLNHVITGIAEANDADPAGTAAVGSLARLRDQCRQAKERLSADTAAVVSADLPGFASDIRITRPELEQLISEPVAGLVAAIEDTLQRNQVAFGAVAAVATVGGGAAIPLITQRLSERLRAPVVTTPQPQLNVAAGAALVADQSTDADAPTGMAPAVGAGDADAPTGLAPAAWAAGAAGLAAGAAASDGASSATFRALAWSQDDAPAGEPVPYTGADYAADPGSTAARPPVAFAADEQADEPEPGPLPWYKRPPVLFGAAATAALLAIGGLAVTLTSTSGDSTPVTETATTVSMEPSPSAALPPPVTTVTVGPDGVATTTVSQPPPPPPPPSSSTTTATTTTTQPTTTTTTTTTATTTTTTRTTTTTTRPTTTRPTTTQPPPTTTQAPPPTTVDPPDPVTTTVIAPGA